MERIDRMLVVNRTRQYVGEEVRTASSLARRYGSELLLLHLISNPVEMEALNAPLPFPDGHKRQVSIQDEAREEIGKILRREALLTSPTKIIIRDGDPSEEVVDVVKKEKIDLMVVLAHEQSRIEHMLFGREDDEIIRTLPCSILLVKKEPGPVVW